MSSNYDLKEDIRDYWSRRSKSFDRAFGHKIEKGLEAEAWAQPMRDHLGKAPKRVLELACGTGEVTRLVHDLGHDVTALDFSEDMLAVARLKHAGKDRLRFLLADAGQTWKRQTAMMLFCVAIWFGHWWSRRRHLLIGSAYCVPVAVF